MESPNQPLETLQDIKQMMERSTRFISLSGLSGIAAGVCGLAASVLGYMELNEYYKRYNANGYWDTQDFILLERKLFVLGILTMAVALAFGFFFTWRKAKKINTPIWNSSSKRLLLNLFIPLIAGAVFIIGMLYHHEWRFIGPACLIFYGLALINGSKYTLDDIRYLGILEMILGSINLFYIGYGIYFWAVGFGLLHIVYGIIMWNKYERKEEA